MSISVISDCRSGGRGEPLLRLPRVEAKLKGDVVGSFSRGRIRALAEKADLTGHDFGPVALAASVLRVVLAGSQPTLDIDLPTFAQEPLARIGQPSECDDPMPIGALLFRAVAVRKPRCSGQREISHFLPRWQSTNVGVSSQIADHDHLVN